MNLYEDDHILSDSLIYIYTTIFNIFLYNILEFWDKYDVSYIILCIRHTMFNSASQMFAFSKCPVFACLYLLVSELFASSNNLGSIVYMWRDMSQCDSAASFCQSDLSIGEFRVEQASCPPLGSQPTQRTCFLIYTLGHTFYSVSSMWGARGNSVLPVAEGMDHSLSRV